MTDGQQTETQQESFGVFLPLLLLGASFIILLIYQLVLIFGQRGALQAQIREQTDPVARAVQAQGGLQRLVGELVTLSATDPDAKAIVVKYKIAINNPAAAPAK